MFFGIAIFPCTTVCIDEAAKAKVNLCRVCFMVNMRSCNLNALFKSGDRLGATLATNAFLGESVYGLRNILLMLKKIFKHRLLKIFCIR